MALTLLVENNSKIENYYVLNLSTWLGLETTCKTNAQEAITLLSDNPKEIGLIITRFQIGKETTAQEITQFLKSHGLKIPLITIGPTPLAPSIVHIPNALDMKLLIKSAATCLGITAKEMMEKMVPDFYPIQIDYFQLLSRSPCDIFEQEENQYTLLINKNEIFAQDLIKKLKGAGVERLYIDKLYRLEFVSYVSSEYLALLPNNELTEDEQVIANSRSLDLLSKKLLTMGVTEETVVLAKKGIDNIKYQVKRSPQLSRLVERLVNNQSSYLYLHTQVLSYVALHMIKNIDWGTPEQEDKIIFISFFHDIALETDEQAKIKSNTELKLSKMSAEKKKLVEKHAQIAGELVGQFPHSPMGADQIIKQHHGQLNGIGFSEHYGANISPMTIVFVVAEEFTRIILSQTGSKIDREDMLRELKIEFPTGRFSKILDLLKDITF